MKTAKGIFRYARKLIVWSEPRCWRWKTTSDVQVAKKIHYVERGTLRFVPDQKSALDVCKVYQQSRVKTTTAFWWVKWNNWKADIMLNPISNRFKSLASILNHFSSWITHSNDNGSRQTVVPTVGATKSAYCHVCWIKWADFNSKSNRSPGLWSFQYRSTNKIAYY